jgi:hypothetical protein
LIFFTLLGLSTIINFIPNSASRDMAPADFPDYSPRASAAVSASAQAGRAAQAFKQSNIPNVGVLTLWGPQTGNPFYEDIGPVTIGL